MFESATNLDIDDLFLGTDFTPVISSTQESVCIKKRPSDGADEQGNLKSVKVDKDLNVNTLKHTGLFDGSPSNVVKRKFPGPAGLLPERSANINSVSECKTNITMSETIDVFFCSQRTVSTFEDGPWSQMTKDFFVANNEALYEKFNISWIKRNSTVKKLLKAPFLAAIIQSVEMSQGSMPTVNVTLKDTTGDIQGTILYSLYEEKADYFTTGSVIVLKQFGVLMVQNNFFVTITPNNLLVIYNSKLPKMKTNGDKTNAVSKILVQEFSIEDIWKRYHEDLHIHPKSSSSIPTLGSFRLPILNKLNCSVSGKASEESVNALNKLKVHKNSNKGNVDEYMPKSEENVEFNCSQISIKSDKEHTEIWKNLFEDVDTDLLFDDF